MTTIATTALPVPEPDLTPEAMRDRMIGMRDMLRSTQPECEAAGRLPEHINQAFIDAGFFRAVQPRRFGGYEFGLPEFLSIMIEAARGCPSCGWTLCLTSAHTHTFALFGEDAQIEAYGDHGNVRAPFVAMPGGVLTPTDGGTRSRGSGITHPAATSRHTSSAPPCCPRQTIRPAPCPR